MKDPIPDNFATLDEAAAFWDSHDFADYWNDTQEVEFEVRIPRRRHTLLATSETKERCICPIITNPMFVWIP